MILFVRPEWKSTEVSYLSFDAGRGQLPPWGCIDRFAAVIVTGSGKNEPYSSVAILES